jgi:hypothetical protein
MRKNSKEGTESLLKNKKEFGNKKKIVFPKIVGKNSVFDKFSFN